MKKKLWFVFFVAILFSSYAMAASFSRTEWEISKNYGQEPDVTKDSAFFDYGDQGDSQLKKEFYVAEDSFISFNIETNLYTGFDGYLDFYIDGTKKASFTGLKSDGAVKSHVHYFLEKGNHTVSWKQNDPSEYYTDGEGKLYASVSNIKVETANLNYSLDDGFGTSDYLSYEWNVSGDFAPVLEDFGVKNSKNGKKSKALVMNFKPLGDNTTVVSKKIKTNSDSLIRFFIEGDISKEYDGYVEVYIDDKLKGTYVGNPFGSDVNIFVDKGEHILSWKFVGIDDVYFGADSPCTVKISNLSMEEFSVPEKLYETFDNMNSQLFAGSGEISNDAIYKMWAENQTRAPGVLKDEHGNVYKLTYQNELNLIYVDVAEKSALSFDYKSCIPESDGLKVFVDNVEQPVTYGGDDEMWRKGTVILEPGIHTVLWKLDISEYFNDKDTFFYLDNISLAKDVTSFVEIYPKGLQETYINGDPIQFSAKAFRDDGSERENVNVRFAVNGGGSINKDGLFIPIGNAGTYKVTATIDGKAASNNSLKVHNENYLYDPVTIGDVTFYGGNEKEADGFFVMEGYAKAPVLIQVKKNGTHYVTDYLIQKKGNYSLRIWLRFGPGEYNVKVLDGSGMKFTYPGSPNYMGDLAAGVIPNMDILRSFTVTNTNKEMTEEEAIWLMPSDKVRSDSFIISNIVNAILAELPENATLGDKLRSFHDWELHNLFYDIDYYMYGRYRKIQDAVSVVNYRMGICEGYSHLYASFLRKIGVQTKIVYSDILDHSWNHVLYNGKWYLVDVTWDDPIDEDYDLLGFDEKNIDNYVRSYGECYLYFMTGLKDKEHVEIGTEDQMLGSMYVGWY